MAGSYAYVADRYSGLVILRFIPPVVPPASVAISGPASGLVGSACDFTATTSPISSTLPLTYTWQATGQATITHTGGLSDTVAFTWMQPVPR